MSQHDVLALDANFEVWKRERAAGLTNIEPFQYYAVEHITKRFNLTDDQVRYGITDRANDGGIDAVYCLAGRANVLIRDDAATSPSGIDGIRIMVFQSKSSLSKTGFEPEEIDKFGFFIDDLLDMTPDKKLTGKYTPHMLSMIAAFKKTYLAVAQNFPALLIEFYYVTRGDGITLNTAAAASRDRVLKTVEKHRGKGDLRDSVDFYPVDTQKLLEYVRKRRLRARKLKWTSQPIPIGNGYVGMASLRDYFDFLKDEKGTLDELIFESNVRGSQGKTSVNKQMRAALDQGGPPDFWQLNNGVTITCTSINPIDAYSLLVDDAQVVNGLQTSRQIFGHFAEAKIKTAEDKRVVLIKLIPVTDDAIRDKIIRATNNQNPIKSSVLLLTGEVHREIEDLFKRHGLFYDRRPGFYKDQGAAISQIVSLNEVSQATIAILLHRPDDARARPGDYLGAAPGSKSHDKSKLLFRPRKASRPMELGAYLKCVLIVRHVEEFLKAMATVDYSDRRNLLFYLAYYVASMACKSSSPSADDVIKVRRADLSQELLQDGFKVVNDLYMKLSKTEENRDVVAKGPEMLVSLRKSLPEPPASKDVGGYPAKKIKDVLKAAEFAW